MFQFFVDAKTIQLFFLQIMFEAVFRVSQLFLKISFLTIKIWLEPNDPVIDFVLSSAGHSQVSASVFFRFKL